MKVKIGDNWFSSSDQAICIEVNDFEQEHIATMSKPSSEDCSGKYASFPEDSPMSSAEMLAWMNS